MQSKARNSIISSDEDFTQSILHPLHVEGEVVLPQQFTYPFLYTPHPLAIQAASQLQAYLATQSEWQDEISRGKMFGVLVVDTTDASSPFSEDKRMAFLAAFSGLLDGKNRQTGFVPPIFDLLQPGDYYQEEDDAICAMPGGMDKSIRSRNLQLWLFDQYHILNSRGESRTLTDIFAHETCRIPPSGAGECCAPKLLQYAYSHGLKPLCMAEFWLGASPVGEIRYHGHYYPACQAKCKPILRHMLQGLDVEENPLLPILRERAKQMQVIYEDDWIIAVDKPAGMLSVKGNIDAPSVETEIDGILRSKPAPIEGDEMRVFIVHRLDMDTSGIMLIAKDKDTHKELQTQFYRRIIEKRYVAWLDGNVADDNGVIDLPLSPNHLDRPRQMVNHMHGKHAVTRYEVLQRHDGRTLVAFYPETGRTHQLRVHAASIEGLGCPIVGDRLYGMTSPTSPLSEEEGWLGSEVLMLHAESIAFIHPHSGEKMTLTAPLPTYF